MEAVAAEIRATGATARAMAADAGSEADVKAYVAEAVTAFGGIDAIYANAGISGGLTPFFDLTVESWQEILRVNLIGPSSPSARSRR